MAKNLRKKAWEERKRAHPIGNHYLKNNMKFFPTASRCRTN